MLWLATFPAPNVGVRGSRKHCERADAVTLQAKFERDEFERIIEAYGHPYA